MNGLEYQTHKWKAALGIALGLAVACVTGFQCHETWIPGEGSPWGFLIVLALPALLWGCSHLAQLRGYPSGVAPVLLAVSLPAAGLIGFSQEPKAVGLAFVFVGMMAPVVIISLPVRFAAMRRSFTVSRGNRVSD